MDRIDWKMRGGRAVPPAGNGVIGLRKGGPGLGGWALFERTSDDTAWRRISEFEHPPVESSTRASYDHESGTWHWVPPPSKRRWRTLITFERDLDGTIWAQLPGWNPRLKFQAWSPDGYQLDIPVELLRQVRGKHVERAHVEINIGAEHFEDLDFEAATGWEWES